MKLQGHIKHYYVYYLFENDVRVEYKRGMNACRFLRFRIHLFFNILTEIEEQGAQYRRFPINPATNKTYSLSDARQAIVEELQGEQYDQPHLMRQYAQ